MLSLLNEKTSDDEEEEEGYQQRPRMYFTFTGEQMLKRS